MGRFRLYEGRGMAKLCRKARRIVRMRPVSPWCGNGCFIFVPFRFPRCPQGGGCHPESPTTYLADFSPPSRPCRIQLGVIRTMPHFPNGTSVPRD